LPKGIKKKWWNLLDYNEFDCRGTQMLVTVALRRQPAQRTLCPAPVNGSSVHHQGSRA
jgi:hypothetical protein